MSTNFADETSIYLIKMSVRCGKKKEKGVQQIHFISGESLWENPYYSQDICSDNAIMTSLPFRSIQIPQTWYQPFQRQHLTHHQPSSQTSYRHMHILCTITTLDTVRSQSTHTIDTMTYFYTTPMIDGSSRSKLLLCAPTAGFFEQREASERLSHRQLAVDFVVPCAHIDSVSCLLLLSDHCQDTVGQTAWMGPSHTTQHTLYTQLP